MPHPKRRLDVTARGTAPRRNGSSAGPASIRLERKPRTLTAAPARLRSQLEVVLWLVIAAVAAGLRLLNVDANPLQPAESALAMDSWRILHRQGLELGPSPLLVYLNTMLFLVLGATDAVARAAPAVIGTLVALSPVMLRQRLGREGALIAAAILATSPTLVFASRSVDPTMVSLGTGLGVVILGERYARQRRPIYLYVAAVLSALLLMSGPLAFDIAVILVGFAVVFGGDGLAGSSSRTVDDITRDGQRGRPDRDGALLVNSARSGGSLGEPGADRGFASGLRIDVLSGPVAWRAIGGFALTVGLIGTGFATNPEGLGDAIARPLAFWAQTFSGISARAVWTYPALLLGYEPVSVVFGVVGVVQAFRERRALRGFLAWWACTGLLLLVLSDGSQPLWSGLVVLPLALLAGPMIARLIPRFSAAEQARRLAIFAVVVCPLIVTTLIAFGHVSLPDPVIPREVALAPPLAILAFVAAYAFAYDGRAALDASLVIAAGCLLAFNIHAAMLLNPGGALNPAELFLGTATSPDVRRMVADVATVTDELRIAQQIEGRNVTGDIEVLAPYAEPLAWYLRGQENVRVVTQISDSPAIAIVGSNDKAPRGAYAGEHFQVSTSAPPPDLSPASLWRWWMYREAAGKTGTYVTVFVKTQLAQR